MFKNEQSLYEAEGVRFPNVSFADNQPIVELIESRGGLLSLIDDIVKTPGKIETKDAKLSESIDKQFGGSDFFVENKLHQRSSCKLFSIHHYAGTVTYNLNGFCVKNMDTLLPDLYNLLSNSETSFMTLLSVFLIVLFFFMQSPLRGASISKAIKDRLPC